MKSRLPTSLISAAAAFAAVPAAASTLAPGSDFRLSPTPVERTDLGGAVSRAVSLHPSTRPAAARKSRLHRSVPTAFDAMPDTNLNYARSGGPAVELGVLGSEIGRPKGLVHFALDWDF